MKSSTMRALVGLAASAAFLWTLILTASPLLHSRIHKDANRPEHTCAVTLVASGSVDHAAAPILVGEPVPVFEFSEKPILTPAWVDSLFLSSRIFEHAPPALS